MVERQRELECVQAAIRGCDRCVRAGYIPVARPMLRGSIGMRMMVVGQAPAALTHERPLPYAGATGRMLGRWLEEAGFGTGALHTACYLTSLTKCFPGPSRAGKGDRAPSAAEIALCREHLDRELTLVRPLVVLALGRLAATALVGLAPLSELVGTLPEVERAGHRFVVVPLPHPSGVSRWLNAPIHQELLRQALGRLGALRAELGLEESDEPEGSGAE